MNAIIKGALWAGIVVAIAIASRLGWADRETAEILMLVAPILAALHIANRGRQCSRCALDG